jgi:NAD(P)-dependent dehydrogenase (short-subunit alcohol dehydrogenase family)
MGLEGKVAVVTGAASGIGKATARALAERGAHACVCDLNAEGATKCAEELRAAGLRASAFAFDVADPAAVREAFLNVDREVGTVDILVAAAGIPGHGQVVEADDKLWRTVLAVDLDGVFYCLREALRRMLPHRAGTIVAVSSMCGIMGCASSPAYSAAKAGVIGLCKSCARRHASEGIRINVIAPGVVDTPFVEPDRRMGKLQKGIEKIPVGRMGRAEDIGELAAFLCSEEASFIIGQVISPNGGQLI